MFRLLGTGVERYLESNLLPVYYAFIILCFTYLIIKHKFTKINLLIVMIFLHGFFSYLSSEIFSLYKFFILLYSLYLFLIIKGRFRYEKQLLIIIFCFANLSFMFLISSSVNDVDIVRTIAQYLSRYLTPFVFVLLLYRYQINHRSTILRLRDLVLDLIFFQGIFSLVKILIFGFGESLVGSIQFVGGGTVNVIPLIGLGLLFHKTGIKFQGNWRYLIVILLVPLASNKRTIWFYLPVFLILMFFYVDIKKMKFRLDRILAVTISILILFVVTIKLTPSLNPDGKIWGRFDLGYTINYSSGYMFSDKSSSISMGRASTIEHAWNSIDFNNLELEHFFGIGFDEYRLRSYEEFDAGILGVGSKGSLSSFSQDLLFLGLLGMLAVIIYQLAVVSLIPYRRLMFTYTFLVFLEYFIYYNNFFGSNALAFSFFLMIILFKQRKQVKIE